MDINEESESSLPEVWLRGPVESVPPLLQPVAHAIIEAQEEIHGMLEDFSVALLWEQLPDLASVGFHLQHIPGILDRLFTYSAGSPLNHEQLKYLSEEGMEDESLNLQDLLDRLDIQVIRSINYLKNINPSILTDERTVGRRKLPSTVIGLLFHAAEHAMRHTGQLLVTVRMINAIERGQA